MRNLTRLADARYRSRDKTPRNENRRRGRSRSPQLGGKRAYGGPVREDRSPFQSRRSIASAECASPHFWNQSLFAPQLNMDHPGNALGLGK